MFSNLKSNLSCKYKQKIILTNVHLTKYNHLITNKPNKKTKQRFPSTKKLSGNVNL